MTFSISVVIPVYKLNSEETLYYFNELVRSIVSNMVYGVNYSICEIIVIDDSPIFTNQKEVNIILEQFNGLCDVRYIINPKNEGQAFSRNVGSSIATGYYIHFIDQDDLISKEFYRNLLCENKNYDIIMADCVHLSETKKSFYRLFTKFYFFRAKNLRQLRFFLFNNIANSPGQYIVKNKLIQKVNGFPLLVNKGSDDFGIFLRFIETEHTFNFVNKSKFHYRTHIGQASNILNMRLAEMNAFEEHEYGFMNLMYWIRLVKLEPLFSPLRIIFYKLFYVTFK
jgi:hypothetical protein